MKPVLTLLTVLLIFSSTAQALPLLNTEENAFLTDDLEELYNLLVSLKMRRLLENLKKEAKIHALLSAIGMNDEIVEKNREEEEKEEEKEEELSREIENLNILGRMVREENDEESSARHRRAAIFKRLIEGNVTFPEIDEEALQGFIERFHKTLPSKEKEHVHSRGSSRIETFPLNTEDGSLDLGEFDLE
nr:hypothetical protein HmN_000278900 [Hymenolepis microstoma]